MRSLWAKILLAFVAVVMSGIGVLAVGARVATDNAFAQYVEENQTLRLQYIQQTLADYYAAKRSWQGAEVILESGGGMMGRMMGSGMMGSGMMGRGPGGPPAASDMGAGDLAISDPAGLVLVSVGTPRNGQRLSARELSAALPIIVDGRPVGLLSATGGVARFSALEETFLSTVNQALLAAALLAGLAAVALSLLLARRLSAPLVSMTQAAQAMAQGRLDQRVSVQSADEIGQLAGAFNTMASSLERGETLRRNLVADVAHELRTPIAVLRADLEAIQDGVYPPTPQRMTALREEVDLLARLVADLQELSLAEAGQLALERRPVDLAALCRQVATGMAAQAGARGVRLELGRTDQAISNVDPDRLGQVLRNLVSNALRYTPAGGAVTLECVRAGDGARRATLAVRDAGAGIAAEDLPHVFDRFYRGEKSRARATGGAGLGLAIARQLVEVQGGAIRAESTLGQGSVFYVELPTIE